jgi:hypothetical protein
MEALSPRAVADQANSSRSLPESSEGFLAQPEMRSLIQSALDLGWTLVAYEADSRRPQMSDRERINWRENQQALNLIEALNKLPTKAKLLVWCGNSHHAEISFQDWTPMGYLFKSSSGIDPFTINQNATVEFPGMSQSNTKLVEEFRNELEKRGGTAGFLREEAPYPFHLRDDADAFIVSTENKLE